MCIRDRIDNSIVLPGVETTNSTSLVANGEIEWQAGGQPTNRLAIMSTNPVSGNGVLSITTDPFSGSNPENYLNLILAGNQSVGASSLVFQGWGRIAFGSVGMGVGDTQSLNLLQATSDFSGILNFNNANVSIQNVELSGNGFFQSKGGTNTVKLGAVYTPGNLYFGSALGTTTFDMGAVQAANLTINGATVYNMPGGSINLGGSGTALLEATENFGEVGVNGNVNLAGGNLTVSPSGMGLQVGGNYFQNGGDLTLDLTPSGPHGYIGTGGTYQISGGNVIINGETGNYTNGANYWLLESLATNGGNVYNPNATYYVYNGAHGNTIDGLTPYLKQVTATNGQQSVQLCLGSACVAQPAKASPAPSQPAKSPPVTPSQPAKASRRQSNRPRPSQRSPSSSRWCMW
jgi:hypothetical protein